MLRIFIFFCLLGTSALQAQFIQWQHSRIVQDDYRGADHPDAVVDGVGNLHICYWDRLRDRLMYGVRAPGAATVSWQMVNSNVAGGLRSAIALDAAGRPHIAYLVRSPQDEINVGYTYLDALGAWQYEPVQSSNCGAYNPLVGFTQWYLMPSLDLVLSATGEPLIGYFCAPVLLDCNQFFNAGNPSPVMKLFRAYKVGGVWQNRPFRLVRSRYHNQIPLFNCWCNAGIRHGEWVELRANPNLPGRFIAITPATCDGEMWMWQQTSTNLADEWDIIKLDSCYRVGLGGPPPTLNSGQTINEVTWEGFGVGYTPDNNLHIMAHTSQLNGWNSGLFGFTPLVFNPIIYTRRTPAGAMTQTTLQAGNVDTDYRSHTTFASVGNDRLFFVYANRSRGRYEMRYSTNGGTTFTQENVIDITGANMRAPLRVAGDSLLIVVPDPANARLLLGRRPQDLTAGWTWTTLNESRQYGLQLALVAQPSQTDTILHIAYEDRYQRRIFYRTRVEGVWQAPVQIESGTGVSHLRLARVNDGALYLSYIRLADYSLVLQRSTDGLAWTSQTVYNTTDTDAADMVADAAANTVYLAFNDVSGKRLLYRARNSFGLSPLEVVQNGTANSQQDQIGEFASITIDNTGKPQVAYWDRTNGRLRWARREDTNTWTPEVADESATQVVGRYADIVASQSNSPTIAHQNFSDNSIRLSKRTGPQSWADETIVQATGSTVGEPLAYWEDSNGTPWLLYNNSGTEDYLQLVRRKAGTAEWVLLGLPAAAARMGKQFATAMLDSSYVYILARDQDLVQGGVSLIEGTFFPAPPDPPVGRTAATQRTQLQALAYPNPLRDDYLSLQLQMPQAGTLQVGLYDMQGRPVQQQTYTLAAGVQSLRWPLQPMPAGPYLCKLQTSQGLATLTILKH
jgi:hypothetical protein